MSKYRFIDKYSSRFGTNWLLKRLGVYPNAYYNYKKKRGSRREKEKDRILKRISVIYHENDGTPGYRMMCELLKNEGIRLSPNTVHKYMNTELGLRSVSRKKKKYKYHKGDEPYKLFPNLIKREFSATRRNEKWCIDFTYLFLKSGAKRYNCTIIDLYDRRVVSSVCGRRINTDLAIETVKTALQNVGGETGMILHSDQGSQFTSKEFVKFCKKHGITQSMSKPGCPYDNAPMERYFNTLKTDLIKIHSYETEKADRKSVV